MTFVPYVPIELRTPDGEPEMRLLRTYVYYDRPVLFLAEWLDRGSFIVVLTSESDDEEHWLASPLSAPELVELGSGELDFRSAFVGDGSKMVARIRAAPGAAPVVGWTESSSVPERDLPDVGTRLPGPWLQESTFSRPSDARAIFRVVGPHDRVDRPHPRLLGDLMTESVWLLELGAAAAAGQPVGRRGKVPGHIADGLSLTVAGFARGSFGIVLDSESKSDPLFSEATDNPTPLLVGTLDMLADVLSSTGMPDTLRARLRGAGVRYASHLRRWLQAAADHGAGLAVEWVSAQKGYQSHTLPPSAVRSALGAVQEAYIAESEIEITAIGELHSYDDRNRRFSMTADFMDPETGEIYRRTIQGAVHSSVPEPIEIPQSCLALLRTEVKIDQATGDDRELWTLLALQEPPSDEGN